MLRAGIPALLFIALATTAASFALPQGATAAAAGAVVEAFPTAPDATRSYIVYLHGRIVEEQGRKAVSPDFGPYELDAILTALAASGATVVGEVRAKGTDPKVAAEHVVTEVRRLVHAGVPASKITIVGASKGSLIAMLASTSLQSGEIGYVLMANCNETVTKSWDLALHGQVLSIYDTSDEIGGTCAPLFAQSPAIASHDEVKIATGKRHGFLYSPLPEWVKPALQWSEKRKIER